MTRFLFTDISGFKDGELRPQYSLLKQKIEDGEYQQILFSEFSRLDRKPSNLLRSIVYYQKHDVHLYFKKQNLTDVDYFYNQSPDSLGD